MSYHICHILFVTSKSQALLTLKKRRPQESENKKAGIMEAPYSLPTTNRTVIMTPVHLRILRNKIFSGSKEFVQPHRLFQSFMNIKIIHIKYLVIFTNLH